MFSFYLTRGAHEIESCMQHGRISKEGIVAPVSNNDAQAPKGDAPRANRRERRTSNTKPTSAEIAAESASIYPDTFDTPPSADEIAAEAYAIYQSRGGDHGRHEDDWFEAERRLNERRRNQQNR
jgi:hypothetical protein